MHYTYDPAGRQTSTTAAGRTLTYQYDPAGNRTRLTWPDGYNISTHYDPLNRPLSLKEGGTIPLATYTWDDLSRRTTLSLGNGTASTNSHNAQGNLSNLTHDLAGTNNDLGFSYIRNQRGEITTANPLNPQSNWNFANPPQSRTANGLNQYTTLNGTTLTHDPNGNLQSDGIWTYGHDPDNRLVTAVRNNPAGNASLGYDPAGRLARTVVDNQTTDLLYDGTDLIAEYDGTGTLTTRHIHGPGIDEPLVSITGTTKTWRYADHLGSLIAEADAVGNATAIRGYGPFGENGTMAPNRFGYTGQQYIAGLGLYYYKARWYSPTLGRFLETDPIGYGDGVNWYAYVGNSPVNAYDPSGLELVAVPLPGTGNVTRNFLFDSQIAPSMTAFVHDIRDSGIPVTVNLAFRTTADQTVLYNNRVNNPNPVASPGTSRHEGGFAIDLNGISKLSASDNALVNQIASKYGLSPIANDPPHFQANPVDYGYSSKSNAIQENQFDYLLHATTDFVSLPYQSNTNQVQGVSLK